MAKKKKAENQPKIDLTDTQKRMDQYIEACNKEKKGKILALSMVALSIVCLIFLLIIGLKMNGVGFTAVVDNKGNITVVEQSNVDATLLSDTVTAK